MTDENFQPVTVEESDALNKFIMGIEDDSNAKAGPNEPSQDLAGTRLEGTGKLTPYIGWYWRDVDFTKPFRLGDCGSFVGFMENNKWDYPVWRVNEDQYRHAILKLRGMKIIAGTDVPDSTKGQLLREFFDYMQTCTESGEKYVPLPLKELDHTLRINLKDVLAKVKSTGIEVLEDQTGDEEHPMFTIKFSVFDVSMLDVKERTVRFVHLIMPDSLRRSTPQLEAIMHDKLTVQAKVVTSKDEPCPTCGQQRKVQTETWVDVGKEFQDGTLFQHLLVPPKTEGGAQTMSLLKDQRYKKLAEEFYDYTGLDEKVQRYTMKDTDSVFLAWFLQWLVDEKKVILPPVGKMS